MAKFQAADFLNFDRLLSEEEILVRETVRDWVDARILPVIREHYENGTFPMHLIPEMGELGLLGANLHGYGAAGLNNVAYGLAMQELERGDSGIRSFASVQGALVMYPILTYGSEKQRKRYLPKLAGGEWIGCYGLTEPDFGSNPGGMRTTAVDDGDSYVLNGTKMWITNGSIADVAVVWAKLDGTVNGFLVEKGTPGFETTLIQHKLSLRASVTSELIFNDCRIPKENRLPEAKGLKYPLSCLTQARYSIAWGAIGSGMACYDEALQYAKSRVQFDRPIAGYQLTQEKLVKMLTEITKMQFMTLQLGRLKDKGLAKYYQVSMAKQNNVYQALEIARTARDILGANGIVGDYQAMRHAANLESVKTYEGTHDIHTLIVGENITGISAFTPERRSS
ncbi:acyl-CoA dehydrogenase [bacterium BMS3Abin05]|nr:acyl-CoA dehydrogenase [bacterium BMS3Abin05]HDZ13064.1 acyl-CoA dehydrogenase [Bacteroidota bacterium]